MERLQDKDALRDNRRQYDQNQFAAVARFHEPRRHLGMCGMVLNEVPDNQVRVDEPPLAHCRRCRPRGGGRMSNLGKRKSMALGTRQRAFKDRVPG